MRKIVEQINALEPTISALSDADLSAKTPEFKQRYNNGESLDKLLPEAFAVCREAAKRVMGMRHYDVQLIGGITLHEGKIAEMRTGEGKTLMGTLACYLNALSGQGVHVITVNDYLAQRDAELNRPLFEFWAYQLVRFIQCKVHQKKRKLILQILLTVPITNSVLTTYVTTWCFL